MNKYIYSLFLGASVMLMTSCMEVDNFDAPSSRFTGRIIDKTTGENILADQGECRIRLYEKSFSLNPGAQDIPLKQDGTFNNTKLFSGTYDVIPEGAWWPCDTARVGIGGTVTQNFEVTPYLKMVDFNAELAGTQLTMSCRFTVPVADGLPNITEVRPFLSLNQFCGGANHIDAYFSKDYLVSINKKWEMVNRDTADPDKSELYSFTIPVKPGYTYFVRMGARVKDNFEKFNYTEIKKIEVPSE